MSDRERSALEEQLRLLIAALGLRAADPRAPVPAEVLALARNGEVVAAVKRLRQATGLGLIEAKRLVDAIV